MIHGDGGPSLTVNNLDADWRPPTATRQFEAVQRQAVGRQAAPARFGWAILRRSSRPGGWRRRRSRDARALGYAFSGANGFGGPL